MSPPASRRGLSMAEALISLVIAATLLTAAAGAFRASAEAVSQNDDFFRATQAARVTLNRVLSQVRRGTVDTASTSSALHLITDTGLDINYNYSSSAQTISYVTNSITTDADSILAHNVSSASYSIQTGTDSTGATCVSRVAVQITVNVSGNQILLSGSAAPRRSLATF